MLWLAARPLPVASRRRLTCLPRRFAQGSIRTCEIARQDLLADHHWQRYRRMLKYLLRRHGKVYVDGFVPHTWTRDIGAARRFKTKREALEYAVAAELLQDECEIVSTVWVYSDAKMESISRREDVRDLTVCDPSGESTDPWPTDQGLV